MSVQIEEPLDTSVSARKSEGLIDLSLVLDQAIKADDVEQAYALAPLLAEVPVADRNKYRRKLKAHFGRRILLKDLDADIEAQQRAIKTLVEESKSGENKSRLKKSTARLLATIADMPERKALLKRKFLWTPEGIYKIVGPDVSSGKITDLWLVKLELTGVIHVWEPSEAVDGLLSIDDKRYQLILSNGNQRQELEISRKDATAALKPEWPNKLYAVPQPDELNWKKLGQFLDEVSVHCPRPPVNHYTATGLLKAPNDELHFCVPRGPAITPTGRDETGMVRFPIEYQNSLDQMRYQFYQGDSQDAIADFLVWMKLRDVTVKKPGAATALQATFAMAPLSQLITPPNLFIKGRSGSKKSTLARLALQASTDLYGHGSDKEWCTFNLRAGSTTDFYMEQLSYHLAGMVLFVDDILQQSQTPMAAQKALQQWSKLLGYALTQRGSGRGRPNRGLGGTAKNWYVRGPLVGTAEVLPKPGDQASTFVRCAVLDLDGPDCLDLDLLTKLQSEDNARAMNRAYTGYIQWLLRNVERAREHLRDSLQSWTSLAPSDRIAEVYARLETGAWLVTEYGYAIGALTEQERDAYGELARKELRELATEQGRLLDIEEGTPQALNPVEQFKRCLARALTDQKLCLVDETRRKVTKTVFDDPTDTDTRHTLARHIPQPPLCLPEDFDMHRAGWKFNNNQDEYERGLALMAGSLHTSDKPGGGTFPYTLKIRSTEWGYVYKRIEESAEKEGLLLSGAKAMLDALVDARIAKKDRSTTGFDGPKAKKYHLINMTWLVEPDEENETPPDESASLHTEQDAEIWEEDL